MIPTFKVPYRDGDLRIGWASWDNGSMTSRSIKYAYPDASGKISRGSPELPFDILVDMILLAQEQGELNNLFTLKQKVVSIDKLSEEELNQERKQLKMALISFQKIMMDLPWVNLKSVYNEVGERIESIDKQLSELKTG